MKKNNFVLALCFAALAPAGLRAQSATLYPINFDESQRISSTLSRCTNSITLASSDNAQQSVDVNQTVGGLLYIKRLDDCLLAKAGETVTAGFQASLSWMCSYVYIDLNNNGLFDLTYDSNSITDQGELMTYSMFKDKNSNGASVSGDPGLNAPAFKIPADTKPGIYRIRYKVDWDCVDPGGNNGATNKITTNGGAIIDTRINIHGDQVTLLANGDAQHGSLTLADGAAANNAKVTFGTDLKLKANAEDGYKLSCLKVRHGYNLDGEQYVNENKQWQDDVVNVSADEDGLYTLPASYVDGDLSIEAVFAKVEASEGMADYGLAFDKTTNKSATSANSLNSLSIAADGGKTGKIDVAGDGLSTIYHDLTSMKVAATPGMTLSPSVDFSGTGNAYLFVDLNQDGRFSSELDENGAVTFNSELMSYSYLNGRNSKGEMVENVSSVDLPSFSVPQDVKAGCYRARLVINNNNASADGSEDIRNNGGYVIDFLLDVHDATGRFEVNGIGGHVVDADGDGIAETVTYGQELDLIPLAPASGYVVDKITVRHGHNLKGEQFVNGNRQWDEYEVTDAKANEEFTVPADLVDGDVMVNAVFTTDGTEEYKLVFADEFNSEDGSMPDSNNWQRCTRENPTWKRFTSQTEEGQARTAFIRDGKLVTRCIANDIEEEGNVEMISGAIESSDKMYYTYGRIEGRLRTTPHTGNFPAFWLMPQDNSLGWPNAGEIDLWEQIDTENKTYHTVHTHVTYDLKQALPNSGSAYTNSANYHIIAMEWEPDLLTWYVDGTKAFSYAKSTNQTLLDQGQWPYDKPFYVILNQSVGNGTWARPCDVSFEYETLFDYVRLYQKDGQSATLPPTTGIGHTDFNTSSRNLDSYAAKGGIILVAPQEQTVAVADITGRIVYNKSVQGNVFVSLPKGVYIVKGKKILVD